MNKKIVATVLVVIAFFAVAPKIAGLYFAQKLTDIVANINAAPGYQAQIKNQQAQWFSSTATINIQFKLPDAAPQQQSKSSQPIKILRGAVTVDAKFGPIIIGDNGGLIWANWTVTYTGSGLRDKLKWPADKPFYVLNGQTNIFGSSHFQDQLQGFTYHDLSNNIKVTMEPYSGKGSINSGGIQYQSHGADTRITDKNVNVTVSGIDLSMKFEGAIENVMQGGLYNSDGKFTVANMQFHQRQQDKQITVKNLGLITRTRIDKNDDSGNVTMSYHADSLDIDHYVIEDLAMEFAVNHLDAGFVRDYQTFLRNMQQQAPKKMPQAMQAFLRSSLLPLLKKSPQMNLTQFHSKTPDGIFDGHINTSIVNVDALPDDLQDKNFWLSHLLVDGDVSADQRLITLIAKKFTLQQLKKNPNAARLTPEQLDQIAENQAPLMLNNLIQNGMLVKQGKQFVSHVHLEKGTATVNKLTIPLASNK